jgi:hypothetical protein
MSQTDVNRRFGEAIRKVKRNRNNNLIYCRLLPDYDCKMIVEVASSRQQHTKSQNTNVHRVILNYGNYMIHRHLLNGG